MEKKFTLSLLLDFYGKLLTEKQREIMTLYFNDDLSLSEIAAREGISRQGVYDAVHRAQRQLEDYERQLGLLARYRRLTQGLSQALEALCDASGSQAERAREILAQLLSEEEG